MAELTKTNAIIIDLFKKMGLTPPSGERLDSIVNDNRSLTQIRDDLLTWGKNQGGEVYKDMITHLVQAHIGDTKVSQTQLNSIVAQITSGQATLDEKYADIDKYILKSPSGDGTDPTGGGTDPNLPLNILSDPNMKWYQADNGKYYVSYPLPGGQQVIFEAEKEQVETLFGKGGPPNVTKIGFKKFLAQSTVHFGGNLIEVSGKGSWSKEFQRELSIALDASDLPSWMLKDPAAQSFLWLYLTEERSETWLYDQIKNLTSFKAHYPGLDKLMKQGNMSVPEAIDYFSKFKFQVKQAHAAAGFNPGGLSNQVIGDLINKGYSVDDVASAYSVWHQAHKNKESLKAFNEILVANGQQPMTQKQLYEFLQGNAPAKMYEIYESYAINEAAEKFGFGDIFNAKDAIKLAVSTADTLNQSQTFAAFAQVAQQALQFQHGLDIGKYGLDIQDLIDLSFGQAPRSGKDLGEVVASMQRLVAEGQAFSQGHVNPFTNFSQSGTPQQVSLGNLRQAT